ncbi:MAG TPA: hypothetical protein VFT45_22485 [Longimicrobium sp.]|nr:hypothetical protein [Longimicrobium sp.]
MVARLNGIALLSLFAIAACDGGGTTPEADAVVAGLAKVSGDAQSTQVILPASPGGAAFALEISALASHDAALLPDLLVARIELAKPSGAPASSTAPIPVGTAVQWDVGVAGVPGADPRCGVARTAATRADDSAHVVNGWRKGTLANVTCVARASLYVGSTLVEADSFTAQFTPGPPEVGKRLDGHHPDAPHQLLLDPRAVQDAYGNAIPFRIVTVAQDTFVWAGGAAWGTAESRTLHWKDIRGSATEMQEGYFYLVNEAGARIAWVSYRLFPTQTGMEYTSLSGVKGDF